MHFEFAPPNFLPSPMFVLRKYIELTQKPYSGSLLQQHLLASLDKFALSFVALPRLACRSAWRWGDFTQLTGLYRRC